MAVKHILKKLYSSFGGIDKRTSELIKGSEFALEFKNGRFRKTGSISKRRGSHIASGDADGGYGLTTYKKVDDEGIVSDELLLVRDKVYKVKEEEVTLSITSGTISNAGDNEGIAHFVSNTLDPVTSQFNFKITRENEDVVDELLGTGDEDSNILLGGSGGLKEVVDEAKIPSLTYLPGGAPTLGNVGYTSQNNSTVEWKGDWAETSTTGVLDKNFSISLWLKVADTVTSGKIFKQTNGDVWDGSTSGTIPAGEAVDSWELYIENYGGNQWLVYKTVGWAFDWDTVSGSNSSNTSNVNYLKWQLPAAWNDGSFHHYVLEIDNPFGLSITAVGRDDESNTGNCSDPNYTDANQCSGGVCSDPMINDQMTCEEHSCSDSNYTDQASCVNNGHMWGQQNTWTTLTWRSTWDETIEDFNDALVLQAKFYFDNEAVTLSPNVCYTSVYGNGWSAGGRSNFRSWDENGFNHSLTGSWQNGNPSDLLNPTTAVAAAVGGYTNTLVADYLSTLLYNGTLGADARSDIFGGGTTYNVDDSLYVTDGNIWAYYRYGEGTLVGASTYDAVDGTGVDTSANRLLDYKTSVPVSDGDNYGLPNANHAEWSGIIAGSTPSEAKLLMTLPEGSVLDGKKAAFLPLLSNAEMSYGSPLTIKYLVLEALTLGDATFNSNIPFPAYAKSAGKLDNTDLENISFAQLNNVLYMSNGYDEVMKYDGNKVYRAGLPQPVKPTVAETLVIGGNPAYGLDQSPSNADQFYFYKYVYEYIDNMGNLITSTPSESAKVRISNGSNTTGVAVTFSYIQPGTGFDIDGPTDEDKIKIKIYRTKQSETETTEPGAIYYLINSFTTPHEATGTILNSFVNKDGNDITNGPIYNDKTSSTGTYLDFLEDSDINPDKVTTGAYTLNEFLKFSDHIKRHDLPPKGKYITDFQNCLVLSGQKDNVNNLAFSLPFNANTGEIGSEYFPNDSNQEIVESRFGDKITAIAPLKDVLYIFHKNSIHTLSGSITESTGLSYQIDLLTSEGGIGCEAQASIQELQGNLFFLSKNGIYNINNSTAFPKEISAVLQPEFKDPKVNFNLKKAVSFNWVAENSLMFILPVETLDDDGSTNYALTTTTDSKIFIYDYTKNAWIEWTNLDFSGGITLVNDEVYFSSRSLDATDDLATYLYTIQNTKSSYDYVDHTSPINFQYKSAWDSVGEPTMFKKFLRLKVFAIDPDGTFESPSFVLNTGVQKNYVNQEIGIIPLDFAGTSAGGWGNSIWGVSSYGNQILESIKTKLPSAKSRALCLDFTNDTVNENVLIGGYEVEIAGPYKKEIKE